MTTRQKQSWVILGTLMALLLMAMPTFAAKGAKANKANNGHGKVTAIGNNSITVTPKTGEAKTFTTSDATVVTLDGASAHITDVIVGDSAKIKSADGKAATQIDAKVHKKGGKKKAVPAAPVTPATPAL
jgi:ABC-type Fe3+-hydroxamate transport system substrate-binding protein